MKRFKGQILTMGLASFILLLACTKDKTIPAECVQEVSFAQDVLPIIETNCSTSGCHDASASGGYNLSSYVGIEANADIILNVIKHETGVAPMPQGQNQLPDSTIQKIECWAKQGKLNN